MKTRKFILLTSLVVLLTSCNLFDDLFGKKSDSISGTQSDLGKVGAILSTTSSPVPGVSNVAATVVSLENGVSVFSGTAVVTNSTYKNILANHPGTTINGNNVTVSNIKIKATSEGVESVLGFEPGIIVRYDSEVGDVYKLKEGGQRKVVEKSTEDTYPYGFMLIKTMKIEEYPNKLGVKKITYWANHRFGIVGIEITYDDNSTSKFPIFNSEEN